MYKVFVKEHLLYFSEKLESNRQYSEKKVLRNPSKKEYRSIVNDLLKQSGKQMIHIQTTDAEKDFELFCNSFRVIQAAGGLVKNAAGALLFIYRLEKWDLPKGKVEEGESIENASIREVEEECGISGLEIVKKDDNTYHMYVLQGEVILKKTHWFQMNTNFSGKLIPQTEEDISEVCWINPKQMQEQLNNTYPSIRELLDF